MGSNELDMKAELQEFIGQDLLSGQQEVGVEDNLLTDGLVDSVGAMRLVAFIEESLGVKVPPEEFTIENFRTINVLGDYLQRKVEAAGDTADENERTDR